MATTAVTGNGTYQRLDAGAVRQTVQACTFASPPDSPLVTLGDVALELAHLSWRITARLDPAYVHITREPTSGEAHLYRVAR